MKNVTEQPSLAVATTQPQAVAIAQPTSLDILDAAVRGGVTSENVSVVKEIIAMRRDELKEQAKADFAKAFFKLKKALAATSFYADKAAMNNGKVAYIYCSEQEISAQLEPVLFANGFAMLFGQRKENGEVVAIITLIHEGGHQEDREYSVRTGSTNAMKDATAADAGSTTSAWRHLVIKMFGLKSRISETDDARNIGDTKTKITPAQASDLEHRAKMCNIAPAILNYVGSDSFANIPVIMHGVADRMLTAAERRGK